MFRPPVSSKPPVGSPARQQGGSGTEISSTPTTIKEIRSRASVMSNGSRNLLNNKRQALSMERLNSPSSGSAGATTNEGTSKSSPPSGNSSLSGSPSRPGGGLNRTASRVSRFRSAKAVFERLSNTNSSSPTVNSSSSGRPEKPEKPKSIVTSRFVANTTSTSTNLTRTGGSSPSKSRAVASHLSRFQRDTNMSASNSDIHRATSSATTSVNSSTIQPKPQPRINSSTTKSSPAAMVAGSLDKSSFTAKASSTTPSTSRPNANKPPAPKPPSKDLIDKIVLEIARDAGQIDPNCTIQDLVNCDISDIPDTIDFDKCFQDVEMMTEEEAKRLLSRKSNSPEQLVAVDETEDKSITEKQQTDPENSITDQGDGLSNPESIVALKKEAMEIKSSSDDSEKPQENLVSQIKVDPISANLNERIKPSLVSSIAKTKVRFSVEPVKVFDTFAVEDYDRRNDDIDPVAASAEYEMEKSRELQGIRDDDENDEDVRRLKDEIQSTITAQNSYGPSSEQRASESAPEAASSTNREASYIDSLEREVALKRILEQNLRDLQSQYYEVVRNLDNDRDSHENQRSELQQSVENFKSELESAKSELSESHEKYTKLQAELNEIKDSSQLLEKKYHRAKKIIKDMQSREHSFNRREQLYQQKLDEIEFELATLIESIDRTVMNDGLKFYSLIAEGSISSCQNQHHARLDVFGLLRQALINFSSNKSTQNPQIKQRVVTILEQQLASLMATTNGNTSVTSRLVNNNNNNNSSSTDNGVNAQQHKLLQQRLQRPQNSSDQSINVDNRLSLQMSTTQQQQLASSHAQSSLSQPIQPPQPVGVGGQPTKFFHGSAVTATGSLATSAPSDNDPSPPQSVNSYPSSNSLNSLNINNNNNNNNIAMTNNNKIASKLNEQQQAISDIQKGLQLGSANLVGDEPKFQPVPDIQVPYQTDEWHEKPVSEWNTTQVSTWLLALGLDQYISKFEDRNVNGQSLINLDSTVLKGLGVLNSNDRNLLKKKIRELRVEMEKERKLMEKKLKENLKERSKATKSFNAGGRQDINLSRNDIAQSVGQANQLSNNSSGAQQQQNNNSGNGNKPSWKRGLLS